MRQVGAQDVTKLSKTTSTDPECSGVHQSPCGLALNFLMYSKFLKWSYIYVRKLKHKGGHGDGVVKKEKWFTFTKTVDLWK